MEKRYLANINNKAKITILISCKADYRANKITRDKSHNNENIKSWRKYSLPECVCAKQKSFEMRGTKCHKLKEVGKFTIIVRDFNSQAW